MSDHLYYSMLVYFGSIAVLSGLAAKWRSSVRRQATVRKHAAQDAARRRGT